MNLREREAHLVETLGERRVAIERLRVAWHYESAGPLLCDAVSAALAAGYTLPELARRCRIPLGALRHAERGQLRLS